MIALILICIVTLINKTNCQQPTYYRLTPQHGTNTSDSSNSFICPGNGAITAIKYYAAADSILSLEFVCSSSAGITSFGPYGTTTTGTAGQLACPSKQYISSFNGTAGPMLSKLGVRCRTIKKELTGNGTYIGGVLTKSSSPAFDDYAYANGARPVGGIIWTTSKVEAIQFTYANTLVELCSGINCTNYKEKNSKRYGSNTGLAVRISVFRCSFGGVITLIKTKITSNKVTSLQFGCTSGVGTMMSPVYGLDFGTTTYDVTTVECPPGTIVGSIHGYNGTEINAIGIRCVVYGETGESPKFDAQGGLSGTAFDDAEYSNKGWRPVQIRVYYGPYDGVYGIQVKYGNAKVATNCKVTNVAVIDDSVEAKSDGVEVIGVATELSCLKGKQMLKLDSSHVVTKDITIDVEEGGDVNWAAEVSISGTVGFETKKGLSLDYTSAATVGIGGARTWSTSKGNDTTTSTDQFSGTEITYVSPGACIIVGYVDRFKIDRNNVVVAYNYTCETGEMANELGRINLKSSVYGNAHFDDYQIRLNGSNPCTDAVRACLQTLKADKVALNGTAVLDEFKACFPAGSGEVH